MKVELGDVQRLSQPYTDTKRRMESAACGASRFIFIREMLSIQPWLPAMQLKCIRIRPRPTLIES